MFVSFRFTLIGHVPSFQREGGPDVDPPDPTNREVVPAALGVLFFVCVSRCEEKLEHTTMCSCEQMSVVRLFLKCAFKL